MFCNTKNFHHDYELRLRWEGIVLSLGLEK